MNIAMFEGTTGRLYVMDRIADNKKRLLKDFFECSSISNQIEKGKFYTQAEINNPHLKKYTLMLTKEGEKYIQKVKETRGLKPINENTYSTQLQKPEEQYTSKFFQSSLDEEIEELIEEEGSSELDLEKDKFSITTLGPRGGFHDILKEEAVKTEHKPKFKTSILEDNKYGGLGSVDHLENHAKYIL